MHNQTMAQFTAHYLNNKGESFSQIVTGSTQLQALENAMANLPQGYESPTSIRIEAETMVDLDWVAGFQQFEREWRN